MIAVKTFDATGVAPNGKLFAGDLNAIQAAAAGAADFTQQIDLATLRIGEAGLTLTRIGSLAAQLSGDLTVTKMLKGLEGLVAGTYTTAQRNAIGAGRRPYGIVIMNSDTNQLEQNKGTDAVPSWQPVSVPLGANSVTATELADNAVDTNAILNLAVTTGKIANNAVTPAKADLTQQWNFNDSMLRVSGMRVHRHPYANERHIESGQVGPAGGLANDTGNQLIGSATFTDVFASNPRIALGAVTQLGGIFSAYYDSLSTTGLTIRVYNQFGSNTGTVTWVAEGQD